MRPQRKSIFDHFTLEQAVFIDALLESMGGVGVKLSVSKQKQNIPKSQNPWKRRPRIGRMSDGSLFGIDPATRVLWNAPVYVPDEFDKAFTEWPQETLLQKMNGWFKSHYGRIEIIADPLVPPGVAYMMPITHGPEFRFTASQATKIVNVNLLRGERMSNAIIDEGSSPVSRRGWRAEPSRVPEGLQRKAWDK